MGFQEFFLPKATSMIDSQDMLGTYFPQEELFYCFDCAVQATPCMPDLKRVSVFAADILPYQQSCHRCRCVCVSGGELPFDKYPNVVAPRPSLELLLQEVEDAVKHQHSEVRSIESTLPGIQDYITQERETVPHFPFDRETVPDLEISLLLASSM